MFRSTALFLGCAITSVLPLAAVASPLLQDVPAHSFIVQHVDSVTQLHQQVSLDPVVRRRLARHFHTSAPAVTRYIQDNLVLKKITVARTYQVYCIGRNGQEYTINSRLPVGTPVFVMRATGKPVLKLACGNPMVAALPPVVTKISPYRSPELASNPNPAIAPILPALASNGPVVVAMNDAPGVVVMPSTKVAGFIGQLPVVHGGGFPFGYLAGIPILATLAHHSGGGNTNVTPGTTGTTGTGTTTGTTGTTDTGTTGTNTLGTTGTTGNDTNGNNTTGTNGNTTTGTNTLGTTGTTGNTGVTPVPEPSAPAAFAVGGVGIMLLLSGARRRNRKLVR